MTVPVCTKCGRGFISAFAKNAAIDSQPVWWTKTEAGPMCNGQIMHVDRLKQIERVYADLIERPGDLYILEGGDI